LTITSAVRFRSHDVGHGGKPQMSRSVAAVPFARKTRHVAFALLISSAVLGYSSPRSDAARQIVQETSIDGILRITAAQGGKLSDQFASDLPPDLSASLRQALDTNLDYNRMETEVAGLLVTKLAGVTGASTTSFWGSPEGRAIARAEARAFASLVGDESFNVFNNSPLPANPPNAEAIEDAVRLARLPEFTTALAQRTGPSVGCLLAEVADPTLTTCPNITLSPDQSAKVTRRSTQLVRATYAAVSAGDLDAYLIYLRSADNGGVVAALQAASLEITEHSYQRAQADVSKVLEKYAKTHFATVDNGVLRDTTADIDQGKDLQKARFTLALLKRGAPPNALVLMQLARVTLKLSANGSGPEMAPFVPSVEREGVLRAKSYLTAALSLAPADPDVAMIAGHTAYLAGDPQQAVDLLGKAVALGGRSPWLHVNLGDALYAMAYQPPQIKHDILQRAAEEFEASLRESLPPAAKGRAVHQLAPIYADLGDLRRADTYYRQYISLQDSDQNRAYAAHRYGQYLFFYPHDYDGAIAAARDALAKYDFGLARDLLVESLAAKGGSLVLSGQAKDAAPFLEEARRLNPHLELSAPEWARLAATYTGIVGIHASGALPTFAGRLGGEILVRSMLYATPAQIEQMLSWGADPNYLDPEEGTPLHFAILANNVAAVRVLLARGASARTPFIDGRLPCELAAGDDPNRKATLALVLQATGGGPCGASPDFPLKVDHTYRLKKEMAGVVNGMTWISNPFEPGEILLFQSLCRFTDPTVECLLFKKLDSDGLPRDNGQVFNFAMSRSDLGRWQDIFEEVRAKRIAGQ
jgi:tetratricopeptide (TPR) repeat protein